MQSLKLPRNDTKSATTTTKSILKHLHLKTFTLHHHQHQQQHHDNHQNQCHHLPTNKDNKSEITCLVLTEDVVCVKYVCFQCQFYGISNVACL